MVAVWLLLLYAYVMYGHYVAVACRLHIFLVYSLLTNEPLTLFFWYIRICDDDDVDDDDEAIR
jgi:hypothetical protein